MGIVSLEMALLSRGNAGSGMKFERLDEGGMGNALSLSTTGVQYVCPVQVIPVLVD